MAWGKKGRKKSGAKGSHSALDGSKQGSPPRGILKDSSTGRAGSLQRAPIHKESHVAISEAAAECSMLHEPMASRLAKLGRSPSAEKLSEKAKKSGSALSRLKRTAAQLSASLNLSSRSSGSETPSCGEPPQLLPSPGTDGAETETTLRIVHFNDVYIMRNFARLKSAIENERFSCSQLVVCLGGDFLAPSLLSALDQGAGMIEVLNAVGVDYVCFGNHESDVSQESLKQRIEHFNGIWLNSNMPDFEVPLPTHHVLEVTPADPKQPTRSVGFLGLCIGGGAFATIYRDGAFGGAAESMVPVMEAHADAAAELRRSYKSERGRDVDCIVCMAHQDQREDELLAATGRYAAVLGGHDHDLTVSRHGKWSTPVVKAGQDAHHAIVVDLVWPAKAPKCSRPAVRTRVLRMKHYAPDAAVAKVVERAEAPMQELLSATLAILPQLEAPCALAVTGGEPALPSSKGARYGPCTMAMYLAEGLKLVMGADAALINSGAVRGDKEYSDGAFSYADLQIECPFPSDNLVISIDGATLSRAVRKSREPWRVESVGEGGEAARKEGSAALQHDLECETDGRGALTHVMGSPLEPLRYYRVVVDVYDLAKDPVLAKYASLNPGRIPAKDSGRPTMQILVEYFCMQLWHKLVDGGENGQITVEEVSELFDEADVDHSGALSEEELFSILDKRVGSGASRLVARTMLTLADRNDDGLVTREELMHLLNDQIKERSRVRDRDPSWADPDTFSRDSSPDFSHRSPSARRSGASPAAFRRSGTSPSCSPHARRGGGGAGGAGAGAFKRASSSSALAAQQKWGDLEA